MLSAGLCMSDWQVAEACVLRLAGWSWDSIGILYDISGRTCERTLRRLWEALADGGKS